MGKSLGFHCTVRGAEGGSQGDGLRAIAGRLFILPSGLFMISLALPVVLKLFTLYLPSSQRLHFGLHSVIGITN